MYKYIMDPPQLFGFCDSNHCTFRQLELRTTEFFDTIIYSSVGENKEGSGFSTNLLICTCQYIYLFCNIIFEEKKMIIIMNEIHG